MSHGGEVFAAAARQGVAWRQILDFSASINPLGPSPSAREAMAAAMDRVAHYPERDAGTLRAALAAEWGIEASAILAGNGATELLFAWCRQAGTGTIAAPAFSEFHRAWPGAATCRLDDTRTWPETGPVVLTRPANPTGTLPDRDTVLAYARGRRDAVLVDESFIDFCETASLTGDAGGNLLVLRSLTKFWAVPGLRIGALAGDVAALAAGRPPWPVNAMAEAAALESIADRGHAARTRAVVRVEAARMAGEIALLPGMRVWPPAANFLYVETADATGLTAALAARGILVRDCTGWPGLGGEAIRVAVRKPWENGVLLAALREVICA